MVLDTERPLVVSGLKRNGQMAYSFYLTLPNGEKSEIATKLPSNGMGISRLVRNILPILSKAYHREIVYDVKSDLAGLSDVVDFGEGGLEALSVDRMHRIIDEHFDSIEKSERID